MKQHSDINLQVEQTEVNRFGRRIARLRIPDDAEVSASSIVTLCISERVEMLTLRIPTACLDIVHDLEEHGFMLMDCLVYYKAETDDIRRLPPRDCTIREVETSEVDQVVKLAHICFEDYNSHYRADPRLDRGLISQGYMDWARRSCLDRAVAATVLAPVVDEKIVGFATIRRNSDIEGEGVLFGVDPAFSGRGIYGALVDRGKQWCHEQGMTRMVVSTQLDNLQVQRSWINRGFYLYQSMFTFHKWFV